MGGVARMSVEPLSFIAETVVRLSTSIEYGRG